MAKRSKGPFTEEGWPRETWTEEDWMDFYHALEAAKAKMRARRVTEAPATMTEEESKNE